MTTEIKLENKEIELDHKELKLQDLEIKEEITVKEEEKDIPQENNEPKQEDKEKYITLFKRFLHYASENPLYKPGDRFFHKNFSKENVDSLTKLIALESPENIVNLIVKNLLATKHEKDCAQGDKPGNDLITIEDDTKLSIEHGQQPELLQGVLPSPPTIISPANNSQVKQDGTSVHPESLVFALAVCTKENQNPELQANAYKVLRTVCSNTEDFFLFVKFNRELNSPHLLGGRGWKKAISKWYLVWTPFDLSQIVTKHRSHFGWCHRDILRLGHVKPTNPQQKMLFTYALKGYKQTKTAFENSEDGFIKETLKYLTEWKAFLAEGNMSEAAKKLEVELYPLELIPNHMLKNEKIWNSILPRLEIKELIKVLQRVATLGFLRNNGLTVQIFTDALDNYYSKQNCGMHPSEVFIALRNYEIGPKICLELATKLKHPVSQQVPPKLPPKTNPLIVNALTNLYSDLFTMLKPTNKSYLIAIDCRSKLAQSKCWQCRYLTAEEAARLILKTISSAEPEENVTVVGFGEKGNCFPIPIKKEVKLKDYSSVLKENDGSCPEVSKVFTYAVKRKLDIDMFVVLTDNTAHTGGTHAAINNYRTEMKKNDVKLVTCSLTGKMKNHKDVEGNGMMCIYGFDNKVCRVIEAFARGAF